MITSVKQDSRVGIYDEHIENIKFYGLVDRLCGSLLAR